MDILDLLFYCASAVAILMLPVLIVTFIRFEKREAGVPAQDRWADLPIKTIGAFVVPILIVFVIGTVITSRTRDDLRHFLDAPTESYAVSINGAPARDPKAILLALRTVAPVMGHRSSPTVRIRVDIRGEQG